MERIGKCPKCGKDIIEEERFYKCTDCDFAIWKNNRYFEAIGYEPETKDIAMLLDGEKVLLEGLVSKRTGHEFDAYLELDGVNGKYPEWKLSFPEKD